MTEAFQPIAIRPPSEGRVAFALRCVLDLQLLTTYRFLRRELQPCRGRLVDVGAGQAPWRELAPGCDYIAVDVESADAFGMVRRPGVVYYDGVRIPVEDVFADVVLSSEVLEHVPDEHRFMADIARILRPGGTLILTIPWSARLHHLPNDYRRLTPSGLSALLTAHGFVDVRIEERGSAVSVLANKLVVQTIGLLRPRPWHRILWTVPLAGVVGVVAIGFVAAAHAALRYGWGAPEDPLGYGVVARRATRPVEPDRR
jgi:SAM-dependent methyltransferase